MSEQTPLEELAEAYSSADADAMDVLENMDEETLRELDRTLEGLQNSINSFIKT